MSCNIKQMRQNKKFYKRYNADFKDIVWRHLSGEDKTALCNRFRLLVEKPSLKKILGAFATETPPRAFCIAAVGKLDKPGEDAYQLIDTNPLVEPYKKIVTHDLDGWGARRTPDKTYLGILDQNKNALSLRKKRYFEYLLRCSLSLSMKEKKRIITEAPGLSMFQIYSLIKVFEEELDTWYKLKSEAQRTDIANLVQVKEKEWDELTKSNFVDGTVELDKFNHPTPKAIAQNVGEFVKGQDEAVATLATSFYYQHKIAHALRKKRKPPFSGRIEPILLTGPTGSGKSFLVQKMAEATDLPFVSIDAATMVSVGIKGNNVNDALKNLIRKSDYKIENAQAGVIYFDEIDKLLIHHDGSSILSQLLRVMEGSTVFIEKNSTAEEKEFENIKSIDTTHIFFVLGGSFEMQQSPSSGFLKQEQHFADRVDLLKAGIPKELIGRIEEVIVMNRLTKENLREILLHGKASPLQKYREMLALNDHEVIIEDNILDRIIDEASKTPYGARTLNTLLKTFLKKRLFETPSLQKGGKR